MADPDIDESSDIERLIKEARDSLGSFCSSQCKAKCCQRGKLLIHKPAMIERLKKKGLGKVRPDGDFEYELVPGGCVYLNRRYRCAIYSRKYRPQICDDYPLFLRGKTLFVSGSCPGYQQGLLDVFLEKARAAGLNVFIQ